MTPASRDDLTAARRRVRRKQTRTAIARVLILLVFGASIVALVSMLCHST